MEQSRQTFFSQNQRGVKNDCLTLLTLNIQNASYERAIEQAKWLIKSNFDTIVLTEVKSSKGSHYLKDRLENEGYVVIKPDFQSDYGVLLAGKNIKAVPEVVSDFLPHRCVSAEITAKKEKILVTGIYVPPSGSRNIPNGKKKTFQESFKKLIGKKEIKKKYPNWIVLGDLNVLEPNHVPKYSAFTPWEYAFYNSFAQNGFTDSFRQVQPTKNEYSWIGKKGNGYRFDHCFTTKRLSSKVSNCKYLSATREKKLSDHSGLLLELNV